MQKVDASEGVLIVFDRSSNKSWDEKIYYKQIEGLFRE